jgi:succinate dehydrogenase hydrophobic anchor subunit
MESAVWIVCQLLVFFSRFLCEWQCVEYEILSSHFLTSLSLTPLTLLTLLSAVPPTFAGMKVSVWDKHRIRADKFMVCLLCSLPQSKRWKKKIRWALFVFRDNWLSNSIRLFSVLKSESIRGSLWISAPRSLQKPSLVPFIFEFNTETKSLVSIFCISFTKH